MLRLQTTLSSPNVLLRRNGQFEGELQVEGSVLLYTVLGGPPVYTGWRSLRRADPITSQSSAPRCTLLIDNVFMRDVHANANPSSLEKKVLVVGYIIAPQNNNHCVPRSLDMI
jgi:hypothetical protein